MNAMKIIWKENLLIIKHKIEIWLRMCLLNTENSFPIASQKYLSRYHTEELVQDLITQIWLQKKGMSMTNFKNKMDSFKINLRVLRIVVHR